jgi:hypothetical protein
MLCIVLCWSVVRAALPEPILSISFDGDVQAVVQGKPTPPVKNTAKGEEPVFSPGLAGQALQTNGNGDALRNSVVYDVAGIWPEERGTLLFWMKGDDLEVTWESGFALCTIWGNNGWARLYKPGRHPWFGMLSRTRRGTDTKDSDSSLFFPGALTYSTDLNVWRQVALTWQDRRARLYLDGVMVAETPDFHFPAGINRLNFLNTGGGQCIRFDEAAVYGRPLAASELRTLWREQLRPLTPQRLTVPPVNTPPALDGKLGEGEWEHAVRVTGLLHGNPHGDLGDGLASDDATTFLLQYDAAHLYVACISPWPAAVKESVHTTAGMTGLLRSKAQGRDGALEQDDYVEVNLLPAYPNGACYRLLVNGANVQADRKISRATGPEVDDLAWNGAWQAKGEITDDAWVVEMAIPFAEFGEVKPGDVWGLNLIRSWKALQQQTNAWAWGQAWTVRPNPEAVREAGDPAKLAKLGNGRWLDTYLPVAEMVFGTATTPIIQVERWGEVTAGQVDLLARLRNPTNRKMTLAAKLTTSSGEGSDEQTVSLGPQESAEFRRTFAIRNANTASLQVAVEQQNTPVYRSEVRLHREQRLEMHTWSYPSFDLLRVRIDAGALSDTPAEQMTMHVALKNTASGLVRLEKTAALTAHTDEVALDTGLLPLGEYDIMVTLAANGKTLGTLTEPFVKRAKPEWLGNRHGISEQVPAPFQPLKVEGERVHLWGRTLDFTGGLLPAAIDSQGFAMLRAPVAIVARDEQGKEYRSTQRKATGRWTAKRATRVEGLRTVRVGEIDLRNDFSMEYDGLLWSRIKVTAGHALSYLALEIPLKPEFFDVMNAGDYSLHTTGKIPDEGYYSGYRTMLWAGNAYAGIEWICDTQANWHLDDPKNREALQLVMTPEGPVMRVTFVNKPTTMEKPLEIEFGVIATPVKDRVPDYRRWFAGTAKLGWSYAWYPKGEDMSPGAEGWYGWQFIRTRPEKPTNWWISSSHNLSWERAYTGPYVCTASVSSQIEYFDEYHQEWMGDPDARYIEDPSGGHRAMSATQAAKSYQDFFVWRYAKLMEKSPFAALYYDVSDAVSGTNPFTGVGAYDRDGRLHPVHGILGNRQITKRLYTLIKERYPDGIIKYHNSGRPNLAYMSFAESNVDGENTFSRLSAAKRDYRGTMRPDTFRALYMGHNLGFLTEFLPQFTRSGIWKYDDLNTQENLQYTDHITGLVLLHDAYYWNSYVSGIAFERAANALRRVDFSDAYKMIPYWEQQVAKLPEKMYASFFVRPAPGGTAGTPIDSAGYYYKTIAGPADTVIAIFCNESDWQGEMRVPVDWKALGFAGPAGISAENAVHAYGFPLKITEGVKTKETDPRKVRDYEREFTRLPEEYARIEGGALVFPMTPWNFRMIVLQRR